jgi:hypothetical protein
MSGGDRCGGQLLGERPAQSPTSAGGNDPEAHARALLVGGLSGFGEQRCGSDHAGGTRALGRYPPLRSPPELREEHPAGNSVAAHGGADGVFVSEGSEGHGRRHDRQELEMAPPRAARSGQEPGDIANLSQPAKK